MIQNSPINSQFIFILIVPYRNNNFIVVPKRNFRCGLVQNVMPSLGDCTLRNSGTFRRSGADRKTKFPLRFVWPACAECARIAVHVVEPFKGGNRWIVGEAGKKHRSKMSPSHPVCDRSN